MLLLLLLSVFSTTAYKIAILSADVSNSQVLFNYRVASTLADAGHDVTVVFIASYRDRDISVLKMPSNIKVKKVDANIGQTMEEINEEWADYMYEPLPEDDPKNKKFFMQFMNILSTTCKNTVQNKEFLRWMEESKFDIAFANSYHSCPIGLIHLAKIPSWIWLESGPMKEYMSTAVGAPIIPSFISPIASNLHDTMDFWERAKSLKTHLMIQMFYPKLIPNKETEYFREFVDPNFPHLTDLAKKCPLAMINNNELYGLPRPIPAKVINIGGIGAKLKDAKPLPKEFEEIANKGKGLVLFSFGSVAQFQLAPKSWKKSVVGAFKRFPDYQFVVRHDGEYGPLPSNVHFFKWLPQTDLLQHKNTKAFFTHGGYNSLQEAIGAGVPLIMLGLFGDQFKNSKTAEKHGFAQILSKANFTEEAIHHALYNVLHDQKYTQNVKRLSAMVNSQPIPAEMLLVKWTEFVADFKTLDNLVPASQKLSFIQYHCLDIIGSVLLVLIVGLFVVISMLKFIARRVLSLFSKKEKLQ